MARINFKELPVYTGISRKKTVTGDARESFADVLYTRMNGVRAKNLALRIFNSEGEMALDTDDERLVRFAAANLCIPSVGDAIIDMLDNNPENEKEE
ncbi:hypothetical protein [Bacteroides xylanisolvens]|uniref:hypothetical protein n=1 Tax=Bacteroides xylanisolvens TaxID=371601 RepID=UPI0021644078|nr:hypothetical protein [Bacteroides xylanisolvens]UVQ11626.1 hypothetical protein NXW81_02535 [Bacteroides xylanisolvens]